MQIINVTTRNGEANAVNSRELYDDLGLGKGQYSRWAKRNIVEMFIKDVDYIGVRQEVEGNEVESYIVTLDAAKHLCMMARTEKGIKTRNFFIEFEKNGRNELMDELKKHKAQLSALAQYTDTMGDVITEHDKRLTHIEQNRRLEAWQEKALQDEKNATVYRIGGDDQALIRKLHQRVWQLFKKKFHLPRYNELSVGKYSIGIDYLRSLTLADMV